MTFINETILIVGEVSTELTGMLSDMPTFLVWGVIFMVVFLLFTLATALIDRLSGSIGK